MPQKVKDLDHFKEIINTNDTFIFDIGARWCGPCRNMKPIFDEMSTRFKDIKFYTIDVDTCNEITDCELFDITSIPMFVIIQNKEYKEHVVGANTEALEKMLLKFSK